jgi:hypothetical protein
MFNNKYYIHELNQINEQRSKLSAEEHYLFINWKEHMDSFLNDKKYIIINERTYVMIESINSSLIQTNGLITGNIDSSLCDYTIQGLVMNIDKDTINQGFCDHIRINITDNVIQCTELNFKSVLEKKCEELFNNSDFNCVYQYKYYTSYFKENILKKYNIMFPNFVRYFVEKMENKLDEELPF